MKRALTIVGFVLGLYFIVRAIAEPFTIDMTDPSTYQDDWGGPSLAGVLAVHCLPGVIAAVLIWRYFARRRSTQPAHGVNNRAS